MEALGVEIRIDEINKKLDLILEEIELQKKHRREMDDLKDDLMRVGKDIYNSAVVELEEVHDHLQTGDMLHLGKKLLRNVNNISKMFDQLEKTLRKVPAESTSQPPFSAKYPEKTKKKLSEFEINIYRNIKSISPKDTTGVWLNNETKHFPAGILVKKIWFWLPPAIWPESEADIEKNIDFVLGKGAKNFVVNAPWQVGLFKTIEDLNIWAGPFCNTANSLAIKVLAAIGCKGVIVSPELGKADYMLLPKNSLLPLGIVLSGNWPLCVSRTLATDFKAGTVFNSPKGEQAWVNKYGPDFWVYPNWKLDIRNKKKE